MTAYNTFVYLVGEDKERIKIKMTAYNTVYRVGEDKDDCYNLFTLLERIKMTDLFTLLERIKMTAYNTFVYRVGEDKDDCL